MPIHAAMDTRAALGDNAERCDSRSLLLGRFPFQDPGMDEDRLLCFAQISQQSFGAIARTCAAWKVKKDDHRTGMAERLELERKLDATSRLATRQSFVTAAATITHSWLPAAAKPLYARLQSRLMVNMAGGVMENAGLCLDRYGLPYIPGSAVKACARRMVLQALHDWIEVQTAKGGTERPATDDICASCCADFTTPAEMLIAIRLVFGWMESDWDDSKKDGHWKSDLAWACHGVWDIWRDAAQSLCARFNRTPKKPERPWDSLPNFTGSIAFLAAHPNRDPGIELDVVTCHHGEYYQTTNPNAVATDTEEPVPVIFPAIAPQKEGDYFTFPLIPLRGADDKLLKQARTWLAHGLEIFGIGAKTNAGHGGFVASEGVQQAVIAKRKVDAEHLKNEQAKQLETEKQTARAKAKAEAEAVLKAALVGLTPEQQEDKKIELLLAPQFDTKLRAFCKDLRKGGPTEAEKQAIVRALRGPRLSDWQSFKAKATKGDLATVLEAIRALSKTMNLGKMP